MNQSKKKDDQSTFSKTVLSTIIMLYFIGAILGGVLVILAAVVDGKLGQPISSTMFIAYASYIGGPTATAIGFYAWKSKAENLLKISRRYDDPDGGVDENIAAVLNNLEVER